MLAANQDIVQPSVPTRAPRRPIPEAAEAPQGKVPNAPDRVNPTFNLLYEPHSDGLQRVVGSLRCHIGAWKKIGASETILSWISEGVRLYFEHIPVRWHGLNPPMSKEERLEMSKMLAEMEAAGAIRRAKTQPTIVSPIRLVPKPNGKWRLIVNMRHLNQHLRVRSFKMEGVRNFQYTVARDDEMFKVDMKSGYYHVELHEAARTFLGIEWEGTFYEFTVLPFGLKTAPWVFTKVTRVPVKYLRERGIRVVHYLDDFLFACPERRVEVAKKEVSDLMDNLGIIRSDKSDFAHGKEKEFIGFVINSASGQIRVTKKRKEAFLEAAKKMLACKGPVAARDLASVAGKVISMAPAMKPARLFTRDLYRAIDTRWSWSSRVVLHAEAQWELDWWIKNLGAWDGKSFFRPSRKHVVTMTTDASSHGFGAWTDTGKGAETLLCQGRWLPEEAALGSNWRELKTVELALRSFISTAKGKNVIIRTDNQTAMSCINNGGSSSQQLNEVTHRIWSLCVNHDIDLQAEYIPGSENDLADALSRDFDNSDWMLNPRVFAQLNAWRGPFDIDRCASFRNTLCARFNSKYFDPYAEAVNCFTQDWGGGLNNWCHPDYNMVAQVLHHMKECKAKGVILAPFWPARPWWPTFIEGAQATRVITAQPDLLLPGYNGNSEAVGTAHWDLIAGFFDFSTNASV